MKTSLIALAITVSLIGAWAALGLFGVLDFAPLGFRVLYPEVSSADIDADGPSLSALDAVLAEAVLDDGVAYERLVNNETFEAYIHSLANHGPRTTPERFTGGHDKLAYYINAYNAFVLYAVSSFWPIQSVHEVHGWIEVREGFGFFYGLQFKLDGQTTNLYDLEHQILLKRFEDARVHAAINCASESCPPLRDRAYRPDNLDTTLDVVTRQWVNSSEAVTIDNDTQQIRLNAIFSWFSSDFERDAAQLGQQATVVGWITYFLSPNKTRELHDAQENGYDIAYEPYDWSINDAE